jgi:Bacterial membrane protein YfhO
MQDVPGFAGGPTIVLALRHQIEGVVAGSEGPTSRLARAARSPRGRDVLGMGWVLLAACAVLTPAVIHGALGHGVSLYDPITGDQADELIPWSALAWTTVHAGHLPLWNPYSVLGAPLAFNWQSAAFSIPSLVGYLFPLHLAFTVQMVVSLCIAGSGVYVLCRVLGLGVLGCTFGATVYELSGAFVGWLGWPAAGVMSWAGWVFAAALLVARGDRRLRAVVLLAIVLACAVYAGQPDVLIVMGAATALFFVAVLGIQRRNGARQSAVIPVKDVSVAVLAGLALGAPLLLPGVQLVRGAIRAKSAMGTLPVHDLVHLIIPGFDGVPVDGGHWFGDSLNYTESAVYIGVIALVLSVFGLWRRRRDAKILAFGVVAVAMAALAFVPPVVAVLNAIGGGVRWHRGVLVLVFALAVLSGIGMDALARDAVGRPTLTRVGAGLGIAAAILVGIWVFGRGHLRAPLAQVRAHSFGWPAVETGIGLVVIAAALVLSRRWGTEQEHSRRALHRWVGISLLACETVFLVASGQPLWASGPLLTASPGAVALQRTVGSSLVGFGTPSCFPYSLGILADVNVAFGVQELQVYDPVIPRGYFTTWKTLTGTTGGGGKASIFCPTVPTVRVARRFGVGILVDRYGAPAPPGTVHLATIGRENVYRVPGAAPAMAVSAPSNRALPGPDAPGRPLRVRHPDSASWVIRTDAAAPEVVRLHLTDVPGWHATIDGRGVALERFSGVMLQVRVPAGPHVLELHYWPAAFTIGIGLAACSGAGLVVVVLGARIRRRRQGPTHLSHDPGERATGARTG